MAMASSTEEHVILVRTKCFVFVTPQYKSDAHVLYRYGSGEWSCVGRVYFDIQWSRDVLESQGYLVFSDGRDLSCGVRWRRVYGRRGGYVMMTWTGILAVERLTRGIPNWWEGDTWVGAKGDCASFLYFIMRVFFSLIVIFNCSMCCGRKRIQRNDKCEVKIRF